LVGSIRIVHPDAVDAVQAVLPEEARIEPEQRAVQAAVVLQQLRAEMLFVGIDAQVLFIERHAAEAVAQRHHAFPSAQAVEEPIAEVVAGAGVLQAEALHAHEATVLLGDHPEAPLAAFHMVGHLALDPQLPLEGIRTSTESAIDIGVAFLFDHPSFAGAFHHAFQHGHALLVHDDLQHCRFLREAGRVVPPPLLQEDLQAGMSPVADGGIGAPGAQARQQCDQGDHPRPLSTRSHARIRRSCKVGAAQLRAAH
jgi:hypothetical protein